MTTTSRTFRDLTEDDTEASGRIGREAFGFPATDQPNRSPLIPGAHGLGCFDQGQLLARAYDREFDSWFGGVEVPTAGIAGVAVSPEARGRGLVRPLLTELLRAARERGAMLSGLFPSQPGIYRRMGYELITSLDSVAVAMPALSTITAPADMTLRRATAADRAALDDLYTTWAADQNGPLSRRGPSFRSGDEEWLAEHNGITVAERAGRPVGYCAWNRGPGVGSEVAIEVDDLVGIDADAYRALLSVIGSFASISGSAHLETSGTDPVRLLLRQTDWTTIHSAPYMIMVLDVAGLLGARHYPPGWSGGLDFTVAGHLFADQDGGYRLSVEAGAATCERASEAGPVFTPQGLSVVVSGAQSCANARRVGLLSGPATDDATWDALFGGRQPHIRNYY